MDRLRFFLRGCSCMSLSLNFRYHFRHGFHQRVSACVSVRHRGRLVQSVRTCPKALRTPYFYSDLIPQIHVKPHLPRCLSFTQTLKTPWERQQGGHGHPVPRTWDDVALSGLRVPGTL